MPTTNATIDTDRRLRVAVIVGSTRVGRVCDTVAGWFVTQAQPREDIELDVIDLAGTALPATMPEEPTPEVSAYTARIDRADAFVVVTPEYNHGYPASLKHAIDYAYEEWHAKPVAFVSYGGRGQGLRAVEQLRQVFVEVHATTVRSGVSFDLDGDSVDEHGCPRPGAEGAAKRMLDELTWWGVALRDARVARPYVA